MSRRKALLMTTVQAGCHVSFYMTFKINDIFAFGHEKNKTEYFATRKYLLYALF